MKKTLVILLALIMATSVAVTACEEETTNDPSNQNQFEMNFGDDTSSDEVITDESGNIITDESENENDKDTSNGTNSNEQIVNDTVYVLHNAKIRKKSSPKVTNTSEELGTVPFGTAVTRTARLTYWSKISYKTESGATIEGYVSNQLITTNIDTITFIKQETVTGEGEAQTTTPVVSKVKAGSNYRLRQYPLADQFPHDVTIEIAEEKGMILDGTQVTVLEVSKDNMWAKVEVAAGSLNIKNAKGSYGKKEDGDQVFSTNVEVGYVPYTYLEIAGASQPDGPSAG